MPQLDRVIIFPQIFWFFIIFIIFYILIIHFILPKFLNSLKARKKLIQMNTKLVSELAIKRKKEQDFILNKLNINLKQLRNSIYLNPSQIKILFLNSKFINPVQIETQIIKMIWNYILFCNKQILKSIQIYPSSLNLKK